MKKPKLKAKGKKFYRNAHGHVYRVVPSKRFTRMMHQRKMQRNLEAKLNT